MKFKKCHWCFWCVREVESPVRFLGPGIYTGDCSQERITITNLILPSECIRLIQEKLDSDFILFWVSLYRSKACTLMLAVCLKSWRDRPTLQMNVEVMSMSSQEPVFASGYQSSQKSISQPWVALPNTTNVTHKQQSKLKFKYVKFCALIELFTFLLSIATQIFPPLC